MLMSPIPGESPTQCELRSGFSKVLPTMGPIHPHFITGYRISPFNKSSKKVRETLIISSTDLVPICGWRLTADSVHLCQIGYAYYFFSPCGPDILRGLSAHVRTRRMTSYPCKQAYCIHNTGWLFAFASLWYVAFPLRSGRLGSNGHYFPFQGPWSVTVYDLSLECLSSFFVFFFFSAQKAICKTNSNFRWAEMWAAVLQRVTTGNATMPSDED